MSADIPTRRPAGTDELPLTPAQQRMWFIDRLHPGSPMHDELVFRLRGPLDAGRLELACSLALRRHEAPWIRFLDRDGEPVQLLPGRDRDQLAVTLDRVDLTGLPPQDRVAGAQHLVGALRVAPFDLTRGPLIRLTLLRLGPQDHVLAMVMHHIVTDGSSWPVLLADVRAAYAALAAGVPFEPPALELDFGDYVWWQHQRRGAAEDHLAFWREQLAGSPALRLPTDWARPAERDPYGATLHHLIDAELAAGVEATARRLRCTPFMLLLAAYQVLLSRHSGQHDFCVGTPTAGRSRPEFERLVGMFVNILVLRADLSGDPTFGELLLRTRRRCLQALSRQEVPFESILQSLDVPRDPGSTPLFQTLFAVHTQDNPGIDLLPGIAAEEFDNPDSYAFYDLTVDVWRTAEGLAVMVRYDTALFTAATARLLAEQFEAVLRAVVADPDRSVSQLPLDRPADRTELLALGRGPRGIACGATVLADIEERARRQPDAPAVSCAGAGLSYAELDAAANRLARLLRRRGAGPESVVAVSLPRSPDLVTALLAVWKAGAAYLPLDPTHPAARLAQLRADCAAQHQVTAADLLAARSEPADAPDWPAARPGDLAYVIYTSGSTGRPKGVCVPHAALAARVAWMRQRYRIDPADRVLQFATVGFDTHVEEVYPCLTGGAELVLLPPGEQLPDFLAGPAADGLSVLDLPTPYWHELVADPEQVRWPEALRLMVIGADQARPGAVAAWRERFGDRVELVNTYGPTETTVIATAATLGPDDARRRPPIGVPIADTQAYVLDARLRPAPRAVPGELFLGGAGVTRGYLGRPGETADRFVPDPFGPPGSRLYRTGDRARWRPDGQLEFLGRVDAQLKVRGYRVEPGEVEARLLAHPGVRQAAVVPHRGDDGEVSLIAYAVTAADVADLRGQLRQVLPEYLMPAAIVPLQALPLTPNGKLDVAALPAPTPPEPALEYLAPRTDAEELVAGVWREVLGRALVGVHDDFFALGGHSLLATRVAARLRSWTDLEVPVRLLFDHTTLAALAAAVEDLVAADLDELTDEEAQALLTAEAEGIRG